MLLLVANQDQSAPAAVNAPSAQTPVHPAGELEARLGRGLDVEWAVGTTVGERSEDGQEALFALQLRPITAGSRHSPAVSPSLDAVDHILGRLAGRGPGNGAG